MKIKKWKEFYCTNKLIITCCLFTGVLGIVASIIMTPEFVGQYFTDDGSVNVEKLSRLLAFRIISCVGGLGLLAIPVLQQSGQISRGNRSQVFLITIQWILFLLSLYLLGASLTSIVFHANWVLGDDHMFWTSTLIGKKISMPIYIGIMRFYPLGFQEFNLFVKLGNVPYVYYLWQAIKYLLLILTFYNIFFHIAESSKKMTTQRRNQKVLKSFVFAFLAVFILTPFLLQVFADIIFPESTQALLLGAFVLFYLLGVAKDKFLYYGLAWLFGSLALYFKEPTFSAILVAVLTPIILGYRNSTKKQKIFTCMIILSIFLFFLLFYLSVIIPRGGLGGENYATGRVQNFSIKTFSRNLFDQRLWLFFIALIVAGYRFALTCVLLIKRQVRNDHIYVYDGLLYAGITYTVAYYFLKLTSGYYFVPIFVFIFPPLFYYFCRAYSHRFKTRFLKFSFLIVVFSMISIYFVLLFPTWSNSRKSATVRRETMTSFAEETIPEMEIGKNPILFVIPDENLLNSEFEKIPALNWYFISFARLVNFLTHSVVEISSYDPDDSGLLELNQVKSRIRSLEELDATRPIIFLVPPYVYRGDFPEELRFAKIIGTIGGIKIYKGKL